MERVEEESLAEVINQCKKLIIDSVQNAGSGHLGSALSCTELIFTLYKEKIRRTEEEVSSVLNNHFFLSAGHLSLALYSVLFAFGYPIELEDFKRFRTSESPLSGHPEIDSRLGIASTTGPLGQGIANGVGMAISQANYCQRLSPKSRNLFPSTWILCSDGDLQEGVAIEAAELAGHLSLSNLRLIYDSNQISIDGAISLSQSHNTRLLFKSLGWEVIEWEKPSTYDSNSWVSIIEALDQPSRRPKLLIYKTTIGDNISIKSNSNAIHSNPLTSDDYIQSCQKLGQPAVHFKFQSDALMNHRRNHDHLPIHKYQLPLVETQLIDSLNSFFCSELYQSARSLRSALNLTLKKLAEHPNTFSMFLGSSDLTESTGLGGLQSISSFTRQDSMNKFINFGVREHSMVGISNGVLISQTFHLVLTSTYLAFSDYARPAVRLMSMMNLPGVVLFTHDSLFIGADGPTHQPVEQLDSLRLIPNLHVVRPANLTEFAGWFIDFLQEPKPTALVLGRSDFSMALKTPEIAPTILSSGFSPGLNLVSGSFELCQVAIFTSGLDLELSQEVSDLLNRSGVNTCVISILCTRCISEDESLRLASIPKSVKVIIIEASTCQSLQNLFNKTDLICSITEFGKSATEKELRMAVGFTPEQVFNSIRNIM